MKRRTPLRRVPLDSRPKGQTTGSASESTGGAKPGRTRRIRPVNRARRARDFERTFGGDERLAWLHTLPCVVCGKRPVVAHHVTSRGAGGTGDDCVPLCTAHHALVHQLGRATFEAYHDVDLGAAAARTAEAWAG